MIVRDVDAWTVRKELRNFSLKRQTAVDGIALTRIAADFAILLE